jgi:hypothetical protein
MAGILAIESDRTRRTLLMALVREHTRTDVKLVDTVKAAIATFPETKPDLIIAPALLSPADSEHLSTYVKAHAEPHVQMLTISALDVLRESAPDEEPRFRLFRRRPASLGLQYDPHMVGRQIAERLERARVLRVEYEAAPRSTELRTILHAPSVVRSVKKTAAAAAGAMPKDRRWAHRTPQQSPWVWTVRLPWGAEVDLVNISRTGVLLESGSKVSPGVSLELQLSGVGLHRAVMARFVRSEVARVDRRGVRYHAAAQFDQPLDILPAQTESVTRSTSESLAQLVTSVLSDLNQPEMASIRFARGLRGLVRARDVLIRHSPIASPEGTESIYFHVRGGDASRTILQVMFDRNRALTADEFKLLKAAAGVTAGVLELEQLAEETRHPAGRMSEVA